MAVRRNTLAAVPFSARLALFQWLLSLFGAEKFADMRGILNDPDLEGFDENGTGNALAVLSKKLRPNEFLNQDRLTLYDNRLFAFNQQLAANRNDFRGLKYFQYLTLLFSEIYLDAYFHKRDQLVTTLNERLTRMNGALPENQHIEPYDANALSKIALWQATGAGKTLLMHANIWQYTHYFRQVFGREPDSIYLITPNSGLSQQHYKELALSGFRPELFGEVQFRLGSGMRVQILEVTRLSDETGIRRVAVESLNEGNNLVLVDEGHRGANGDTWVRLRDQLAETGFTFEYSATFRQIVQMKADNRAYQTYTRGILFDYSYHHFYRDGFGKDFRIMNLPNEDSVENTVYYLTAALLTFYEQSRFHRDHPGEMRLFQVHRPLLVLVGSRVIASKASVADVNTVSDVVQFVGFLRDFLKDRTRSSGRIKALLTGKTGLLDDKDVDIFSQDFQYLKKKNMKPADIFDDLLSVVFNTSHAPVELMAENLKGHPGEILLRAGHSEPFGVINVGDDTGLLRQLAEQGVRTGLRGFRDSAFHSINSRNSTINVLVGAKKFMEGWSSWRVSCMGLLHVGQTEGAQIIQLFGRGVRLHGFDFSLKRSAALPASAGVAPPESMDIVETLSVFGIRASYMETFKQYVEEETESQDKQTFHLQTIPLVDEKKNELLTIGLVKDADFARSGRQALLTDISLKIRNRPIQLDWYPHVQVAATEGANAGAAGEKSKALFQREHTLFMDFEMIHRELRALRSRRGMEALLLPEPQALATLLIDSGNATPWYTLYVRPETMDWRRIDLKNEWEQMALLLLSQLMVRVYADARNAYEADKRIYTPFLSDAPAARGNARGRQSLLVSYTATVPRGETQLIAQLQAVEKLLKKQKLPSALQVDGLDFISCGRHLYEPLLHERDDSKVEIHPGGLPESEVRFLSDVNQFLAIKPRSMSAAGIYLLKNLTRGKGLGFFEADNFFPDFILWLLLDQKQYISFVDPKGLIMLHKKHPKIAWHQGIKQIERELNDPNVVLNSFIVTPTSLTDLRSKWEEPDLTAEMLANTGVYLMEQPDYVGQMIAKILAQQDP